VSDADGRSLGMSARIAQIKVRDAVPRTAVGNGGFEFGSTIHLLGCAVDACLSRPDPRMEVDLEWEAVGQPDKDYTVSLQLRNAEQVIVAQVDAPPRQGINPTLFWQPGEIVNDHHSLPLPVGLAPGTYTLHVCMYDAATLQRLPVVDPAAQPLPNAEVPLLTLTKATDNAIQVRAGFPALRVQVVPADEDCGA